MLHASLALVLLLLLIPLLAAIAAAVFAHDRGPVIFAHTRIGRNGRPFRCYKFRTMHIDAEARLREVLQADPAARHDWARFHKLRHDPRVTPLGVFLRRSSLDELPQLVNVVRGEMSIVGPRPIVEDERARYGRRFHIYCSVKPGITGLWQVSGRNDTTYRARVAMDVYYVREKRLTLDLHILLLTGLVVLRPRGSY